MRSTAVCVGVDRDRQISGGRQARVGVVFEKPARADPHRFTTKRCPILCNTRLVLRRPHKQKYNSHHVHTPWKRERERDELEKQTQRDITAHPATTFLAALCVGLQVVGDGCQSTDPVEQEFWSEAAGERWRVSNTCTTTSRNSIMRAFFVLHSTARDAGNERSRRSLRVGTPWGGRRSKPASVGGLGRGLARRKRWRRRPPPPLRRIGAVRSAQRRAAMVSCASLPAHEST